MISSTVRHLWIACISCASFWFPLAPLCSMECLRNLRRASHKCFELALLAEECAEYEDCILVLSQDLLMQVFSAFKDALSGAAAMDTEAADGGSHEQNGDAGTAAESRAAWRRLLLGNLRTFARRYFRDAAPLAQRLEDDVFAEGAVDGDARSALLLSFHF